MNRRWPYGYDRESCRRLTWGVREARSRGGARRSRRGPRQRIRDSDTPRARGSRRCRTPRYENHGVAVGLQASRQEFRRATPRNRERTDELIGSSTQELASATGISKDEQDAVEPTVPQLELQTTDESLRVTREGLGLDTKAPIGSTGRRVPGALIAGNREWDLGRPSQGSMEGGPEVGQQRDLSGVSERRRAWVEPHGKVQADNRGHSRKSDERDPGRLRALDATDLRVRNVERRGRGIDAQRTIEPSVAQLLSEASKRFAAEARSAIAGSFT